MDIDTTGRKNESHKFMPPSILIPVAFASIYRMLPMAGTDGGAIAKRTENRALIDEKS